MAETTIEWTATARPDGSMRAGFTFNPWVGCTKVSRACDHCYAEDWAKRTGAPRLWQGERRRTSPDNWKKPHVWNRNAQRHNGRAKVFCASLADVFDNQVPAQWRTDLWALIARTPHLDWLLLTKRPQNIAKMLPDPETGVKPWGRGWPHVWLGCTVENQEEAERRIPHLASVPARVHFLSCEPLLGPVDLGGVQPDWVIAGGESGHNRRPMDLAWARSLRDQCAATDTAFFMKQVDKKQPIPADLMVRQFPRVRAADLLEIADD